LIDRGVDCRILVEVANDWMEGALEPELRAEIELHLATCAGCIAYIEQLRATQSVLSTLGDEPPPEDVRARLLNIFLTATSQAPSDE
jgi:anti-sigma factor RsiW